MTVARLLAAADIVLERGLAKGMLEDEHGCVCLIGALRVAQYGVAPKMEPGPLLPPVTFSDDIDHIESVVGGGLSYWSDQPERTAQDVATALRTAARNMALARVNSAPTSNGRCVGHIEQDPEHGTVLIIDWHDPAGCEHKEVQGAVHHPA